MSHGRDLFTLSDSVTTEPSFELALRGYDKKQVDRYVRNVEAEVATLATEREQAYAQVQVLAGQLQQLRVEMANMRQRNGGVGRPSFRHLGPRVEEILSLAEQQAEAIRAQAREQADTATRDFEAALAARRVEEDRADKQRRTGLRGELAATEERVRAGNEQAQRVRADADAAAKTLADRMDEELRQRKAQVEQELRRHRAQAEHGGEALVAAAKRQAEQVRGDTERQLALAEQRMAELRQQHAEERERLAQTRRQAEELERRIADLLATNARAGQDTGQAGAGASTAAAQGGRAGAAKDDDPAGATQDDDPAGATQDDDPAGATQDDDPAGATQDDGRTSAGQDGGAAQDGGRAGAAKDARRATGPAAARAAGKAARKRTKASRRNGGR